MAADEQTPRPAANDEQSSLRQLKSLLLGPEQSTLERLQAESRDSGVQTRRVADSLPASLHSAYAESPHALTRALERPVSECIEDSVQRNPGLFADILYPVMGPAIRRSITQAMKGLVQHINQTLEYSLTAKGFRWRLEAWQTGKPFAEIVLRHTLRYRVEETFLIQAGSGLLIQHLSQGAGSAKDADAVSAMLTAIRDFARDTLQERDPNTRLETVNFGDHTLWLIHGPKAYLACAIRGLPPAALRDELAAVLEEIHRLHPALLEGFNGDSAKAAATAPLLTPCLRSETVDTGPAGRPPWPLIALLLVLAAAAAWWALDTRQAGAAARERATRQQAAIERLTAAPGIILTNWQETDGRLQISGLHDPLTPAPQQLLADLGLERDDYRLDFRGFQATDGAVALARARQRLAPPEGVSLTLDPPGTLSASGVATAAWRARAALLATTIPGVSGYDDSRLEDLDHDLARRLRSLLQAPDSIQIEVEDGTATLRGTAPLAWIGSLAEPPAGLDGLRTIDTEQLVADEARRLAALVQQIEQTRIHFATGIELGTAERGLVEALAARLGAAWELARQLGRELQLEVIGRTDGTGTADQNLFVAQQRAEQVAAALRASGHALPPLQLLAITRPPARPVPDAELRRVEFRIVDDARNAP